MSKREENDTHNKILEIYRWIAKNAPYNLKLTITNDNNTKQYIKGVIKYERT